MITLMELTVAGSVVAAGSAGGKDSQLWEDGKLADDFGRL